MRVMTTGLRFPEGPIALPDGDVLVVEIARGTLTRCRPDGSTEVVAETGGGPNGAALGPDGKVYICNNGGFEWHERGGLLLPGFQPASYTGGSIQRVDLGTGAVETLYTHCGDRQLRGPNDIVFDRHGGFYFTDLGKRRQWDMDLSSVYYAKPDGSEITRIVHGVITANGCALSPDEQVLYFAETTTGRLWAVDLDGPGKAKKQPGGQPHRLVHGLGGHQLLDSMAVDAEGNICVATLINGGITSFRPDGSGTEHFPFPDILTTNICFGGKDLRTAFVTLSTTGKLVSCEWPRPGLPLNFLNT